MKKFILSLLIVYISVSCEKKPAENVDADYPADSLVVIPEANEPVESSTLQTCYMEVTGKDSVFVSLEDNLGTIIGKIRYKHYEKDSSMGDVVGSKNGDTLKLVYTFEAEGKTSEREIYFLRKGENIIEGRGEQKTEGTQSIYVNPTKLKYEGNILKQINCTEFDQKFKMK